MPGLINRHTRVPMTLQSTRVSAIVNGLSVGITASLTYFNDEDHVVEGVFCIGLSEDASVTGFEARMSQSRSIHVHVKDKTEVDHFDEILTGTTGSFSHGNVPPGRFAVTEYDSSRVFCANLGTIRPHGSIVVMLSISTLMVNGRFGQVYFQLPSVFTPRVKKNNALQGTEPGSKTNFSDSQHSAMKSILDIVDETGVNLSAYDFEFQLEVKAPTLLAGVSSKTHAIRVDADPYATDASDVFITLAEPHPMDRSLEITLHFPRPHVPVVILEHGDMSPMEYENFVRLEREYLHSSGGTDDDNKKSYMQKRMHKDIMHNAVAMLNYCADFEGLTKQMLQHTFDIQGEYIFVIDRSGSMSGEYIANARETIMMFVKSLPVSCRFNIVGFGTSYKALFDCSRLYTQENVSEASSYIKRMRADMGGTNLLAPLQWILQQHTTRGWPRQLFIVTDGGVSNTSEILELVKINAVHTRVHTFGVGENVSKRLIRGIAKAGRGIAEFIATGERMQSKVMNTLKASLQPVISDISLDWTLPGGVEVLQTPAQPAPIIPGEPLVIYGLLCDTVRMHNTLASVLQKGERRNPFGQDLSRGSSTDRLTDRVDDDGNGNSNPASRSRSPIPSPKPTPKNDKGDVFLSNQFNSVKSFSNGIHAPRPSPATTIADCSVKATASDQGEDAESAESTSSRPLSSAGQTAQKRYMELAARRARAISVPDNRISIDPSSIQQLLLKLDNAERRHSEYQTHPGAGRGRSRFRRTPTDCCSVTSGETSEPISPSWDHFLDGDSEEIFDADVQISLNDAVVLDDGKLINLASRSTQCFVTISGLFCGRPISCEVPFDISTLIRGEWTCPSGDDEVWEETIHQLASKCLLFDYDVAAKRAEENGAKRSLSDMPTDEGFKIRAQMIEVSQASHVVCRHTAFVSVDQETLEPLPSPIQVLMPKPKTRAQVRRQLRHIGFTKGLGRRISSSLTDSEDDAFSSGFGRSDSLSSCQSHQLFQSTDVPELNQPPSVWTSIDPSEWSASKMYDMASTSKSKAWHLGTRLSKLRSRLSTMPSKRPLFRAVDIMECGGRTLSMECVELHALVNLQLAYGGWQLDQDLADALDISLDRLKRASPLCMIMTKVLPSFTPEGSRQSSLDFPSRKSPIRTPEGSRQSSLDFTRRLSPEGRQDSETLNSCSMSSMPKRSDSTLSSCTEFIAVPDRTIPILRSPVEVISSSFKDSGSPVSCDNNSGYHTLRPSYTADDSAVGSLTYNPNEFPMRRKLTDFVGLCRVSTDDDPTGEVVENRLWATVLSLVWLEHNCGSFFSEWELLAAKADRWLGEQRLPRGFDIPSLKAAAYQVIVLTRKLSI
ncbi:von Willebrand factor A domain-containing protein 5B1-like isoform X2 [Amphiura filiformis]|uniref:von Willebrand factor A domain-containing protein 5B1-like isoform X2 n=1 Tax=Amphiura filiformis TaxID=82378 RepID=UPI003B2191D3